MIYLEGMSKQIFLDALKPRTPGAPYVPATGSATSVVSVPLMEKANAWFPEAHLDAEKMATLAEAGHTLLGFENVMPVFSTWHEAAALGAAVNWGAPNQMPNCHAPILSSVDDDISIPDDFELRPPMKVVTQAISLLKKRLGNDAAITGKFFGPWTLAYDVYGIENFLIATLENPGRVKQILRGLLPASIRSANAQIEAGADVLALCDHCTRDLCSPDAYRDFLFEIHCELARAIRVPLILHICGDTSDRICHIRETGVAMFHFDSKTGLETTLREARGFPLMGGTSNLHIVRSGTPETTRKDVEEKLAAKIAIIGPECAVPLDSPLENMQAITETVKAFRDFSSAVNILFLKEK